MPLLTQAIASEEELGAHEPAEDLLTMDGMDRHLALFWPVAQIVTMEDLAEQGVDDLMDIEDMTEERAGELIMTARAPLVRRGGRRQPPDGIVGRTSWANSKN